MAKTREIIISEVLEGRDQGNIQTISTVGDTDASSVTHLDGVGGFTRFIAGMSAGVDYTSMSRTYRFQATTRSNFDVLPLSVQIRLRGTPGSQVQVKLWEFTDTSGASGTEGISFYVNFPDVGSPGENDWFIDSDNGFYVGTGLRAVLDEGRLGLEIIATPNGTYLGGEYVDYLDMSYIGLLLSSDPVSIAFPPEVETSYGVKSLCWIKADSTTQPSPPVSGDVITTWRDENGATWESEEPRGYGPVTWSTNQVNGKPAFHFGGTDGSSSGLSRTDPTYQELPEVTVFAVLVSEVSGIFDIFTESGYYESGPLDDYYSELFMGFGTRGAHQVARFYSYDYVLDNPDNDEEASIDINANISNDTHVVTIQRGSAGTMYAQFDDDTYSGLPFEFKDFYTYPRGGSGYVHHREGAVPYNPLLAQSYYANHHVGLYCEALVVAGNGAGDWTIPMPASTRKRIQCALAAKWGVTLDQCSVESGGTSGWSVGRTIH